MRHALASETRELASLLEGRFSDARTEADGFKTIVVFCVGPANLKSYHDGCHHNGRLTLDSLPNWDWYDISAHLRCTKCGTVGYVDTRLDWSEVINFNKVYTDVARSAFEI